MARINSGAHIRVQVESVKRRKTQGSSNKRRISVPTPELKYNVYEFEEKKQPVKRLSKNLLCIPNIVLRISGDQNAYIDKKLLV
ncbi:hypothetical protein RclHR1_02060001 [Rhizophagus clarus]|uniref:Uncharacterized protein n=1 Tax=Rhizophagus clarus TaxID=94130 RepID=A0A2Z6RKA2_9GLOM|nr:hypothetical protein RclHR1_02060001 [Rhizophagus clarus]